jgi:hypothetical protein
MYLQAVATRGNEELFMESLAPSIFVYYRGCY